MKQFLKFLLSLFSKGNIEKNKVIGSISKVSVVGDNNQYIDQSSNDKYTINQSSSTNQTIYTSDPENKFEYSIFADAINTLLRFTPLIFLIISLLLIFLTKVIYPIYFLDAVFIFSILFWSYKIPNKYRSFWVFKFNCLFTVVTLIFLFTYKYFIYQYIPTLTEYITVGIPLSIFNKNFFISSEYIISAVILITSCYTVSILSSNTVKQWQIYVFGERNFPLTIKLMGEMILTPFIPFIVLFLLFLYTCLFNYLQSLT